MIGKALYIRDWRTIAKSGWDDLRARDSDAAQARLEREQVEKDSAARGHDASRLATKLDAVTAELQSLQLRATTLDAMVRDLEARLADALASLGEKQLENVKLRSEEAQRQESLARVENELKIAMDSLSNSQERARQATEGNVQVMQELKEQQRQTNYWSQEVSAIQVTSAGLSQSVSELKAENRELRQAVRLANKLQMLSEADLSELRGRYEIALQAQERQQSLLVELESKLLAAAGYFQRLRNAPALPRERQAVDVPITDRERKKARRANGAKDVKKAAKT